MRLRRRRLVRMHLVTPGEIPKDVTLEGFLAGRVAGHYLLERAKLLAGDDGTISMSGDRIEIPVERVFFIEVLAKDGR